MRSGTRMARAEAAWLEQAQELSTCMYMHPVHSHELARGQ